MVDRISSGSDSSQRLLSRIANQIDAMSSFLNFSSPGDCQQPSSSRMQSQNVTVEEEVAHVFNRSARPSRPVSADGASRSANIQANPMYAMRRNFQQIQRTHPYQRTARANKKVTFANKAKANSKGHFYTNVIPLPSPDEEEILHSVHTKIIPPTLAPGKSLDGMMMYRLFQTKAIYLQSSEKLSDQSHQSEEDLCNEGNDIEDFPLLYDNCKKKYTALLNDSFPFEDDLEITEEKEQSSKGSEEGKNTDDQPETIEEIICQLSSVIDYENISEFNVSRNHLWESAKRGCSKKLFSPKNNISVMFTNDVSNSEGAIDMGGPTREFLTLLMNTISRIAKIWNGLRIGTRNSNSLESFNAFAISKCTKINCRIDVVFDVYFERSLKNSARVHRGQGARRQVKGNLQVSSDWKSFLRHSDNKTELFSYLAQFIHESLRLDGNTVIVTTGENALCWPTRDTSVIDPCNHEEADTRIFVHLRDAQQGQGLHRVIIHTVDADVVVLGVAAVVRLNDLQLTIAFGSGQHFRYINVNKIAVLLGEEKARALPMFHAFTGCDMVSFFAERGIRSAMKTWEMTPNVTQTFLSVEENPSIINDEDMVIIEQFVVYLDHSTSESSSVNRVQLELFAKKNRTIENIPPTHASLLHHIHRAALQANCWKQMFTPVQSLYNPEQCGWTYVEGEWQPKWTDLPEVVDALRILVKCGCKKGCKRACKCRKSGLECTALCFCNGDCN
eukprot:gene13365-14740_t